MSAAKSKHKTEELLEEMFAMLFNVSETDPVSSFRLQDMANSIALIGLLTDIIQDLRLTLPRGPTD